MISVSMERAQTILVILHTIFGLLCYGSSSIANSENYELTFRIKHTKRIDAQCPADVYEKMSELLKQCDDSNSMEITAKDNSYAKPMTAHRKNFRLSKVKISKQNKTEFKAGSAGNQQDYPTPASLQAKPVSGQGVTENLKQDSRTDKIMLTEPAESKLPSQCKSAWTLNLTESRRLHFTTYSELHQDYKFLDSGRFWFRFKAAAGNRLADVCPTKQAGNKYGCGRYMGEEYSYWSNSTMPHKIGATLEIVFYYGCRPLPSDIYRGKATRCDHGQSGLVYRFEDKMRNQFGVICGSN